MFKPPPWAFVAAVAGWVLTSVNLLAQETTPPIGEQPLIVLPTFGQPLTTVSPETVSGTGPRKVMIGDQFGFCATGALLIPSVRTVNTTTTTVVTTTMFTASPVTTSTSRSTSSQDTLLLLLQVCNPYAGRVAFKISENESPEPQDRVFLNYNYLNRVDGQGGSLVPTFASSTSSSSSVRIINEVRRIQTSITTLGTVTTTGVNVANPHSDRHAEIIGFEKSCFDENASIGVRVPWFQQAGDLTLSSDGFGDVSTILKYVLWRSPDRGSLVSGGLMVTAPTGPAITTVLGDIHSFLFQPYLGYRWAVGDFYLQGFSSVIVPTDNRDVTLALNSVGIGYTLEMAGAGALTALTPIAEIHVTTPLNHQGLFEPLVVPDIVSLTAGCHLNLGSSSLLTIGGILPVTGPRPFDFGAVAYLNYRF